MAGSMIGLMVPIAARRGEEVTVAMTIVNAFGTEIISALPLYCTVDGVALYDLPISELVQDIGVGEDYTWRDSFTMPGNNVIVHVESWLEDGVAGQIVLPPTMHKDSELDMAIALEGAPTPAPDLIDLTQLVSLVVVVGMMAMMTRLATESV